MGLKEKQAIASLDVNWSVKRIKDYTGKDVSIELDAESFSSDMDAILYVDSRGAQVVANAIAKVCYNDIGKDAFNSMNITKVLLKNQPTGDPSIIIADGKLTMSCGFATSSYYSESELQTEIENML